MRLKTLIVDDEPLAREWLRTLLAPDDQIEVIAECCNGKEALRFLRARKVDLLFLDIRMPGKDGFDVLRELGPELPFVIFVTAFEEYAVRAFEVLAVDYLVKAIQPDRLQAAVSRVKQRIKAQEAVISQERLESVLRALEASHHASNQYVQRFLSHNGDADTVISTDEISWIEAADYYVRLHVGDKTHMIRESIKHLESRLDPQKFIRLHRSAIVNVRFVKELKREGRTEGWAILSTGEQIRMNRGGWQRFVAMQSTL
jgi:two-component system, LytTR family, response regulator